MIRVDPFGGPSVVERQKITWDCETTIVLTELKGTL